MSFGGSVTFTLLAAVVLASLVWWRRRDLRLVALCVLAPVVAGVLQLVTKELVGPHLPVEIPRWYPQRRLVFPSATRTGAATIASLVVVLVLTSGIRRTWRVALVLAAACFALGVGLSRIVADVHLTTDVAGGLLLGTAVAALGTALVVSPPPDAGRPGPRSARHGTDEQLVDVDPAGRERRTVRPPPSTGR